MIIAARYNGPPESGNGGYCSGRFAEALAGQGRPGFAEPQSTPIPLENGVEVTLRRPPPLDTELDLKVDQVGRPPITVLKVYAGEALVAEALPRAVEANERVAPVPFAEAISASASYRGFVAHPFPTCFVCGPARPQRDGLGLFPGLLPDGRTATPFVIPDEFSPELVWASLDCPGGWAVPLEARPFVLGRITARIFAMPAAGQECVVMGAMTGEEGRKAFVHSSLYGPDGDLLATARAVWFAL